MPSRRAFLGTAAAGLSSLAGCTALPAGPTERVTNSRTRRMNVPSVPAPAEPTDAHAVARRAHLDGLVTAAEPLFERASREELGDSNYTDVATGVSSVRDFLEESADDPASVDVGFATSRVRYAGYALGFLRSWYDLETTESAFHRVVAARNALGHATDSMPRECVDPATYLARVGWAERMLYLASVGIDQYESGPPEYDDGASVSRERVAARVGRLYQQAAKATGFALDGRYYARDYLDARSGEATDVSGALRRNRRDLLAHAKERAPDRDAADERAGEYDDNVVSAYVHRARNPAVSGHQRRYRADHHADAGRLALAAVDAGRANCHYAGYERVVEALDPDALRDGVDAAALFTEKRAVVRSVRAALDSDDPLLAWLANEPARLLFAGEVYLDSENVDSEAVGRAVCLAFYRHARGYANELETVVETLERRE